jgi:Na+-transporting NADH:ubiquinone oxidoreductase subunit A
MGNFKIKKGFDIRLEGTSEKKWEDAPVPASVALSPADFPGIKPALEVKEGAKVNSFTPIFSDKNGSGITIVSPVSGTISAVIRGERRSITRIVITPDNKGASEKIKGLKPGTVPSDRQHLLKLLIDTGIFPGFRSRPFGLTADPRTTPRDIFISAYDSAPLGVDWNFIVSEYEEAFSAGLRAVSLLPSGRVHLSVNGVTPSLCAALSSPAGNAVFHRFTGPHPAGNVGVHIHSIAPVRGRDDIVWTCSPLQIIRIGSLLLKGTYPAEQPCAVAGSSSLADERHYYRTIQGACIDGFVGRKMTDARVRYISGNPLTGREIGAEGHTGFHEPLISVIPEPGKIEILGWAMPGLDRLSFSKSFLSSFFRKQASFAEPAAMNGGQRAFIATGIYDEVFPFKDIYPLFLIKAILAGDIEEMEQLGIYELIEEDVALCEYIDPSKNGWQQILRSGLDLIVNEG